MIHIQNFVFNPYQENTYLLYDEVTLDCIIIDPGMHNAAEEKALIDFINDKGLTPILLLNTHCHIDHVLGNHFVFEQWGLKPQFHENEVPVLVSVQNYAPQMGFRYDPSPIPQSFLSDHDTISLGKHVLKTIFAPGHSPGHLCFYSSVHSFLIGGDILFKNSIGRTDLPGGHHDTLLASIQNRLYTLPDDTTVYPGHGPSTTIRYEKKTNPFVQG